MEIKEFKDGYCLTHNNKDYKYQGKSESIIKMISKKVEELMLQDLENLKKKLLTDNFIN